MPGLFNVLYFGAVGDGTTDDTAAIQAAMNAAVAHQGILEFPLGKTFRLSGEIAGGSNVIVQGNGATLTSTTRFRSYLGFVNCSNYRVEGLRFDLAVSALPVYTAADYTAAVYPGSVYNVGIYNQGSADCVFTDNTFVNLYTVGILFFQCGGSACLTRNRHTSPTQAQKINLQHVQVNSCGTNFVIDTCWFDNAATSSADNGVAGVYTSGVAGSVHCVNCYFNYCGRNSVGGHQLGAFSSYGDVRNLTVERCIFLNSLQQVVRLTSCWYVEVTGCFMSMASVAGDEDQMISVEGTMAFSPGLIGVKDIKIHNNTLQDDYAHNRIGVRVEALDWSIPSEDVDIHHNRFLNMKFALMVSGPYSNLRFQHNQIRGMYGGIVTVIQQPGITSSGGVTESQSAFSDLSITDNDFDLKSNGANAIFPDFTKTPAYTGTIGAIDISRNRIRQDTLGLGTGLAGRGVSGAPIGAVQVCDNRVTRYTTAFDLANFAELRLENNVGVGQSTFRQNVGTNTLEIMHGNRATIGKTQGRASLAAGTATISTAEVVAGDNILLSRVVTSGTVGQLSIGTITAGSSFTITSSSGTDTSTVYWVIDH